MHTHTIRAFILSTFAALAGCFTEDFDPFLPYGSSSTTEATGSSTAADTTTGAAVEPEAAPVRACAAPEDVPPSLPGIDLAAELDPLAAGCPNTFCATGYSCGTCCDGTQGSSGTVACCEMASSYSAPTATGGCAAGSIAAMCVETDPDGEPSRRTPTSCEWPKVTCPPGYHIDAPSYVCNYCSQTGQSCPAGGSCQAFCGGQFGN